MVDHGMGARTPLNGTTDMCLDSTKVVKRQTTVVASDWSRRARAVVRQPVGQA